MDTPNKKRRPLTVFILLSLLIHVGVYLYLLLEDQAQPPQVAETVEIEYLAEPPPALAEEETVAGEKKPERKNQIVEQDKRLNDEKPDDARFLSAFDQKVIRETRAEKVAEFNNSAKGGKPDEGREDGDKEHKRVEEERTETAAKTFDHGDLPDLKDLTPKYSLTPGPKGPKLDENGNPSATDDAIQNVQTGMQTLLSTREFVYYAYYNRIKAALRQHWEPNVREKVKIIYRQGRSIASAKDRVTQVLVTLNSKGELVKVEVLTQSGVIDLDSAAVEAFRAAAPFPNPPKGMVETDGTVKIRWDFVLEA